MRVTITTGGSRGDLQPYVALGLGLQRAGAQVRVATALEFEEFVRSHGLEFHPVSLDVQQLLGELLEKRSDPVSLARGLAEQFGPILDQNLKDYQEASRDADAIVYGPSGFMGHFVARAEGLGSAAAEMQPIMRPTGKYRSSVMPPVPDFVGGRAEEISNRLSYVAVHEMFWQWFRAPINRAITEGLGLPPMTALEPFRRATGSDEHVLCGWSSRVLPRPRDYGDHMHVTGYWFLDTDECFEPPAGLVDFLESGPPPVSIGFGSMNRVNPERMAEVVTEALRQTGDRGVLLTGWSGISDSDLPDEVYGIEEVPHDWLFPKVAAAIHHGGAGTTGASLRAGIPTITVPFFFDQRFWGDAVATAGAGPPPIPSTRLSAGRLAGAIRDATGNVEILRRARALGEGIRREDGVRDAIRTLELQGILR